MSGPQSSARLTETVTLTAPLAPRRLSRKKAGEGLKRPPPKGGGFICALLVREELNTSPALLRERTARLRLRRVRVQRPDAKVASHRPESVLRIEARRML